jgi:hypothetical protein
MKYKKSFDNSPKSLEEVLMGGKDVFGQTYDLIITKVHPVFNGTNSKTKLDFVSQSLDVSDGTETVKLQFTPDQYFNETSLKVGDCIHVEKAYLKRTGQYWKMKIKQYKADGTGGSKKLIDKVEGLEAKESEVDWAELKAVYDALDAGEDAPAKVDLSQYKKNIDAVFNKFWGALVAKSDEDTVIAWFTSDDDLCNNIDILRKAGLMSE